MTGTVALSTNAAQDVVSAQAYTVLCRYCPTVLNELPDFRWTTNDGLKLRPIIMETRHLYFSIAMIWHHTMPPAAKLFNHKKYSFGPQFTEEYLELSIKILLFELATRDDLEDRWRINIQKMMSFLNRAGEITVDRERIT